MRDRPPPATQSVPQDVSDEDIADATWFVSGPWLVESQPASPGAIPQTPPSPLLALRHDVATFTSGRQNTKDAAAAQEVLNERRPSSTFIPSRPAPRPRLAHSASDSVFDLPSMTNADAGPLTLDTTAPTFLQRVGSIGKRFIKPSSPPASPTSGAQRVRSDSLSTYRSRPKPLLISTPVAYAVPVVEHATPRPSFEHSRTRSASPRTPESIDGRSHRSSDKMDVPAKAASMLGMMVPTTGRERYGR